MNKLNLILKLNELLIYILGFLINKVLIEKAKKIDKLRKKYYIEVDIEKN